MTNDRALADRLRALRMYGFGPGRIAMTDGRNSRLDELQAAVLRVKLKYFPVHLQRRQEIAARYRRGLEACPFRLPPREAGVESAFHQFAIRSSRRREVTDLLDAHEIGWGVHYDPPLHHMPAYRAFHEGQAPLIHTDAAAGQLLSLPIFPELRDDEVEAVIAVLSRGTVAGETS